MLTIENTDSDLKVHALHYANELLVRVRLSFQKRLQSLNNEKDLWEKSNDVDESADHDKPHFDLFFTSIPTSKVMFFYFSERELKKALRDKHATCLTSVSSVLKVGT